MLPYLFLIMNYMGQMGFEPMTSRLSAGRYNQAKPLAHLKLKM
jgi:hypothetical protein